MTKDSFNNFSIHFDHSGVFHVVLDVPKRPMNILNHEVMIELEEIVSQIELRPDIRLVVFKSGKESGFLAGADVEIIQQISTADQAFDLLRQGQELFQRIEDLKPTTLAVVHGPCLGGGLELALACDAIVARDNSSTRIGLPEIKLGLIPGWGGTQRLPRRVGVRRALELILSGKHLSAGEAEKIGLVDRSIDPNAWRDSLIEITERLANGGSVASVRVRLELAKVIETRWPVREWILSASRRAVAKKVGDYPALSAAIDAVQAGCARDGDGYRVERAGFARLIYSPTCRQLLRLFRSRERARNVSTWAQSPGREIHRAPVRGLAVVGGGAMGAGIAQVAAIRGFDVGVKEVDVTAADRSRERIDSLITGYGRHKQLAAAEIDAIRERIRVAAGNEVVASADCVVEAVVESLAIKQSVLAEIETSVSPSTIIATNTSALSVNEMASGLAHPARFAGLHFFNPVHRMELVEIVRGDQTSDQTIERLVVLVRALGKTPIVTTDSPGFLVNRVLFPYLAEAIRMVRGGCDIAELDRQMRQFGMPMGPLELLDQVGLDVALHVAESLQAVLPDSDDVVETLRTLVETGKTGRKTSEGFYRYSGRKRFAQTFATLRPEGRAVLDDSKYVADGLTAIQRRLVYTMLAESVRCEEERVVSEPWMIDLAMVLGTGFAPHRGGPLAVIDRIGENTFLRNLKNLERNLGDRFAPPTLLVDAVRSHERLAH